MIGVKDFRCKGGVEGGCKPKCEGGLGLRPLKEINIVNELKLIWRILSGKSLWSKWVHKNLIKWRNFWELNGKSQLGSWMWKKLKASG